MEWSEWSIGSERGAGVREGEWSRKGKETVRLGRAVRKDNGERSRREREKSVGSASSVKE